MAGIDIVNDQSVCKAYVWDRCQSAWMDDRLLEAYIFCQLHQALCDMSEEEWEQVETA